MIHFKTLMMNKRLIFLLTFSFFYTSLNSQTLKGSDIEVVKNDSGLNFDFTFNLYFDSDTDVELEYIIASYSNVIDTINLNLQSTPKEGIRKLEFLSNHSFPGAAFYQIVLLDSFPLPPLKNLMNAPQIVTYLDLNLTGGIQYGNNALPTFDNDLSDNEFDNGRWKFNTSASDLEGDSLFYFFIDYSTIDYSSSQPHYPGNVFPSATDSFDINSITREIIWDRPEEVGNYLVGMTALEFSQTGFFLSRQDRFWIIEVTEEDLITSINNTVNQSEQLIKIIPNPSSDYIEILCEPCQDYSSVRVYNLLGHIVYRDAEHNNDKKIDISTLASGVYWLELRTENGIEIKVQSFVVQ